MSNFKVRGSIYQASKKVATEEDEVDYDNPIIIFDSTSLSTGQQTLAYIPDTTTRYKFSDFKVLVFCVYNSSAGWKTEMLPTARFVSATTSNYVCVHQNITSENRRVHVIYVNDITFNIGAVNNAGRFIIYGLK